MLFQLRKWLPRRTLVVVADSSYAVIHSSGVTVITGAAGGLGRVALLCSEEATMLNGARIPLHGRP